MRNNKRPNKPDQFTYNSAARQFWRWMFNGLAAMAC